MHTHTYVHRIDQPHLHILSSEKVLANGTHVSVDVTRCVPTTNQPT